LRSKHGRGHTAIVRCSNCSRCVPKDKAVRKFVVRAIVDQSSARDLKEQSAIETYTLPRLYIKQQYCVSCAIHARIVRVRSRIERRKRTPPVRVAPGQKK
jgi:small subunit ribosomal protein S26e